ncbi:hypothetical protein EVAR_32429_1 [Eumeta japonica]|uniref:Uncharacterized protein n=1 Tax=Eumeta variegata TaxID=151549 RepID=A0A4C1VMB6_EUMVA|nr:hypothetical protein EVAR_32429_1 [Eumeta japonica]
MRVPRMFTPHHTGERPGTGISGMRGAATAPGLRPRASESHNDRDGLLEAPELMKYSNDARGAPGGGAPHSSSGNAVQIPS